MIKPTKPPGDITSENALKRIREKARALKEKNIVPPVDEDEPSGLLSGGPEHLDLTDDEQTERNP